MTDRGLSIDITEAAGYIGSRVVERLQSEHSDWSITALDNFYLGDIRQIRDVEVQHVDIRHRDALEETLSGVDIVMHLAAISGVDDCGEHAEFVYDVNVTGTSNVAWFCPKRGTGLVFPISMAVLGDPESFPITVENPRDPMNWYGRTKLLSERMYTIKNGRQLALLGFAAPDLRGLGQRVKRPLLFEDAIHGGRLAKGSSHLFLGLIG